MIEKDQLRILLIYPPMTVRGQDLTTPAIVPPLGLAYLAAYLEKHGYTQVRILDCLAEGIDVMEQQENAVRCGLSLAAIQQVVREFQPNVVGVGVMFTTFARDGHEVAQAAKEAKPDCYVIFGGAHASAVPEMVLKDPNVDMVVDGEGEETLLEVVGLLSAGERPTSVAGTAVRNGQEPQVNPRRPFIRDLDSIPFPAWHLLPMDTYIKYVHRAEGSTFAMRSPHTFVVTSRGCPGRCVFCSIHAIWGHRWRGRSAANVVDELEFLHKRYGIREFHFNDDNISVNKKRMHAICDEIIARGLDIKWTTPNGIAIWTLDRPLLEKMRASGCYRLTFGIESGSPETLKFMRKKLDLEQAYSVMRTCGDLGLWTFCTYILGFPYETERDMEQTIKYAIASPADFTGFIILMPFPGTDLYHLLKAENLIDEGAWAEDEVGILLSGVRGMDTKYVTKEQLQRIQQEAFRRLMRNRIKRAMLNPWRTAKKIRSWEDLRYTVKVFRNYVQMIVATVKARGFKTIRPLQAEKYHGQRLKDPGPPR